MPVLTISREIGSQGDIIAEKVATRLGYPLVDKSIIEKVFWQYGFVDFKETYNETGFWARTNPHHAETIHLLNRIIEAMVHHGNIVLLGRGGFAVLKGYTDVLNIRIQAPFYWRVRHLMGSQHFINRRQAEEFVRESDKMRREFVESTYGKQWDTVSAFDLVIDTSKISPDMAVDWLEAAIHRLSQQQPTDGPFASSIEVDQVLAQSIVEVLKTQPAWATPAQASA